MRCRVCDGWSKMEGAVAVEFTAAAAANMRRVAAFNASKFAAFNAALVCCICWCPRRRVSVAATRAAVSTYESIARSHSVHATRICMYVCMHAYSMVLCMYVCVTECMCV